MRKLLIGLLVLVTVAAAIVVGGVLYLRNLAPDYDGNLITAKVIAPVEVWRDSAGVPHVWAQNEADLYFTQGYIHAQERLWQLELFRRTAEGRLAEAFGESMIDSDKFLRTLGIWRSAGLNEQRLRPEMRALLQAYAAGVNHFIDAHEGPLPTEFLALRIKPEPWTVRHTLAVEKIMSWDLALYADAAWLTGMVRKLGPEKARYLEPSDPAWGTTIIETPELPAMPKKAALLLDGLSITRASNAWVIGGTRTTSGKPILANDMHLMLRQPGVWYLMALHAPDMAVAGMTLPGVPLVVAGHNRAVAWGFTNVMLDDVDFFIERVDPNDAGRYLTPAGSEPFTAIKESLRVKGRADPLEFTIRVTRHGPVMSDFDKRLSGDIIAMQWAALDTSTTLEAIPRFNRARNAAEFLAAVPLFNNPHQNIVYADTSGRFGYQMGGRIPLRGARRRPPMLPVPGWTGEWDWNGYLPFAEQPRIPDPANGYAVTANNRQVRGGVGDLISNDWELPFRAQRIRELILAQSRHDAVAVHAMQLDVKDLLAVRYKDAAVQAARTARIDDAARSLAAWDGVAGRDSRAAAWFYAWYEMLRKKVAHSLFDEEQGNIPRDALNAALDSGFIAWLGERGTKVLDSLSTAAMREADDVARGKRWGDLHRVVIQHAMSDVAAVEKMLNLNVGPAAHGGSPTTVNVSQYIVKDFPLRTSYGPSQRHVVDMANVDGAGGFILPSGQSGLQGSPHYSDMFGRWRNGGLWRIPLDRNAAEARAVHKTVIKPQ